MTNSKKIDSLREQWIFYLSIVSIYFHFYCMWWTTNIYWQSS